MTTARVLAVLAAVAAAGPVRAAFVIDVTEVPGLPGAAGQFLDVRLVNDASPEGVLDFTVELSVPDGAGVTFLDGEVATAGSAFRYVFDGRTDDGLVANTANGQPADTAVTLAGDVLDPAAEVAAGETVLLGRVGFAVAPGTPTGVVPVTVTFAEVNGEAVTATTGGAVAVAVAVPEPSSLALAGLAAVGGLARVRRRRGG